MDLFSAPLSIDALGLAHQTRWLSNRTDYMSDLGMRLVKEIGEDVDVTSIDYPRIVSFVTDWRTRGLAQPTINRRLSVLSVILDTAVDMKWIESRPKIPYGRESKTARRFLSDHEEEAILRQLAGTPMHDVVVVAVETGMRRSELLKLRWRDVTPDSIVVAVSKNDDARSIPMTRRVREVFEVMQRLGEGPFQALSESEVSRRFKAAAVAAGIIDKGVVFHSLRHTCASRLVQAGVDFLRVKAWLGHRDIQSTLIYAHLAPRSLHDVLEKVEGRGSVSR